MRFFTLFVLVALFSGLVSCEGDSIPRDTATTFERTSISFTDDNGLTQDVQVVTIIDNGEGIGSITLRSDTTYVLEAFVFVNAGQTLTIEPGTVIKGAAGIGEDASALVVARGGKIEAEGEADKPIIFTSVADQTYSSPSGIVTQGGLPGSSSGLWGGLIILGDATLNSSPGESAIEGIPTSETRGLYGGTNDEDNSGTLRYVSIRHGGKDIGAGNEINGVTFGGVGSGTTVEYVEVFGNKDDGFEWFGGTVNTKYLVSAFNQDDAMDYDEGWRGNNQFWLVYQAESADRGGEHDGGTDPETAPPYAIPTIANASYFGLGADAGKRALTFRDNAGGHYRNSIFKGYGKGVDIEWLGDDRVEDSHNRLLAGDLTFQSNILTEVTGSAFVIQAGNDDLTVPASVQDAAGAYFLDAGNTVTSTLMFASDGVTPGASGAVTEGLAPSEGTFFDAVGYKGCIDPATGPTWIQGWTRFAQEL